MYYGNTLFAYLQEKMCLLVMSLPASQLSIQPVMSAIEVNMVQLLQIQGKWAETFTDGSQTSKSVKVYSLERKFPAIIIGYWLHVCMHHQSFTQFVLEHVLKQSPKLLTQLKNLRQLPPVTTELQSSTTVYVFGYRVWSSPFIYKLIIRI